MPHYRVLSSLDSVKRSRTFYSETCGGNFEKDAHYYIVKNCNVSLNRIGYYVLTNDICKLILHDVKFRVTRPWQHVLVLFRFKWTLLEERIKANVHQISVILQAHYIRLFFLYLKLCLDFRNLPHLGWWTLAQRSRIVSHMQVTN